MQSPIQIVVNGEKREVPEGLEVTTLLTHLGLPSARVAIERNMQILPRSQWGATVVQSGDQFEIVQLVGGGE